MLRCAPKNLDRIRIEGSGVRASNFLDAFCLEGLALALALGGCFEFGVLYCFLIHEDYRQNGERGGLQALLWGSWPAYCWVVAAGH